MATSKAYVEELLSRADIRLNGDRAWDMQVHDEAVFEQALSRGNLGLGETYMAGLWDAPKLDQFFYRLLRSGVQNEVNPARLIFHSLKARMFNLQDCKRAWEVGQRHYDIGNALYEKMLDQRMVYTCGYWRDADNLDQAQRDKLELSCQKLGLKPGMRILDIGCGWGSFMQYAAEHYQVECVGVTISKEQVALGEERCKGLPVEFRLQDYRELDEKFDRIISLGMFEHVGQKNYDDYMAVVRRCLKDNGLFLLHTIGKNVSDTAADPWISRYIFPNGEIPSIAQIGKTLENQFVTEDLHNFGADYDKTLMAWFAKFDQAWPELESQFDGQFYRMWKYYLLSCAGAFRARDIQLWQWVLSPEGLDGGYQRPFK
ncbi:MAG: cyclopropane fatty acyl phospholipid synthase [Pseudomonadota bacterium]